MAIHIDGNCCCCCGLFRSISACRCRVRLDDVHDLARIDIILFYGIGVSEFCSLTRRQSKGLAAQVGVVIFQGSGLHADIAFVLHYYRISDRSSSFVNFSRCSSLCNAQFRLSCFRRNRAVAIILDFCTLRILAGRSCCIVDLTCVDIGLLHNVRCSCSRCLARGDRGLVKFAKLDAFQNICQGQFAYRDITSVLHCDRVANGVTHCYVRRLAALRDFNHRFCCFCLNRTVAIILDFCTLRILAGRSCCIVDLTCVDIGLLHNVRCSCSRCLARGDRGLVKFAKLDAFQNICQGQFAYRDITSVLHCDRVANGVTHCYVRRLAALRDFNHRFCCFRSYSRCCCCFNFFCSLRICSYRSYSIVDLSSINIFLCYGVTIGNGLARIRCQIIRCFCQLDERITHYNGLYSYITSIGYNYGICNGIANSNIARRLCCLRSAQ